MMLSVMLTVMYRGGASIYDLATRFGIHRQTVSAILEQASVPRRYKTS